MPNFAKVLLDNFWLLARSSLITVFSVVMRNDFMLFGVGGNPSDSPRRSCCTSPRSWMKPCEARWRSQILISSKKKSLFHLRLGFYFTFCAISSPSC